MIRVENLSFAFTEQQIFSQLCLSVQRGDFLTILGPNGCGKSTLLRLLRGTLKPQSGGIIWNGIPLEKITAREMARTVAVVPQSTHVGFPYLVDELVAMGRYPHRRGLFEFMTRADRKAIRHALVVTDTLPLAERPVTRLSGGELQRVLLARALAQGTEVLFLDEATSHLDIDHRLELSELLVRLNREQGVTIVQISHDMDLAAAVSKRILLLTEHGEMAGLDTPAQVLTADNLRRVFRVEVKVTSNPYTGTPQVTPLISRATASLNGLGIHLICGGGSGRTLLRRLHLAKAKVSAGPLNRGDSDEEIAGAIEIPVAREVSFHPFSKTVLAETREMIGQAEILVVATSCWGEGNLASLDLVQDSLESGQPVYLIDPRPEHDFTGGKAWTKIEALQRRGAVSLRNEDLLLEELERRKRA